jgi:tripeptidyl-peptidase I
MYMSQSALLAVFATLAVASPWNYVIHEQSAESPDEWFKHGSIPKQGRLPVRIGLTQTNLDRGHDLLMEV